VSISTNFIAHFNPFYCLFQPTEMLAPGCNNYTKVMRVYQSQSHLDKKGAIVSWCNTLASQWELQREKLSS